MPQWLNSLPGQLGLLVPMLSHAWVRGGPEEGMWYPDLSPLFLPHLFPFICPCIWGPKAPCSDPLFPWTAV